MRLLVLFLLVSGISFGQDSALLDYVNSYRVANGVGVLTFDSELHSISDSNTMVMVTNDTMVHSGTNTYECVTRQFSLAPTKVSLDGFNKFLKEYYDMAYEGPSGMEGDKCVRNYMLLYVVYSWHTSAEHRKVMLTTDGSIGSCSVSLGDITFKKGYKEVGMIRVYFNKFISHYELDAVATLNIK